MMNLYLSGGWLAIMVLVPLAGMVIAANAQEKTPADGGDAPAVLLRALPYTQDTLEPPQGLFRGIPGPSGELGFRGFTVKNKLTE